MSWQSFWKWLTGRGESSSTTTPPWRQKADPPREGRKTYDERYRETAAMSNTDIHATIKKREDEGKECGILYRVLAERQATSKSRSSTSVPMTHREKADASDAHARAHNIDPPRPGRKTYNERYTESSGGSSSSIRAQIAQRQAQGKETGVLERILADRGE